MSKFSHQTILSQALSEQNAGWNKATTLAVLSSLRYNLGKQERECGYRAFQYH